MPPEIPAPPSPVRGWPLADRPLLRNAGALALSRTVTLLAGLAITAWLGRKLGPSNYGIIGFATAVLSYFALLVGLGLDTLGAREIARHGARTRMLAGHIFTLRLVLAVAALGGLAVFISFIDRPVLVKLVLAIHGSWLLAIALNLDFVYQGRARMGLIAAREITVSLLIFAGIVIAVRDESHVISASVVMMGAMIVGSGLVMARCRRDYGAPVLRFDSRLWRLLLRTALPIATAGIFVTVFRNLDTTMLGFMRSTAEVGFYTAAFKFFMTGLAPVGVLMAAFTPPLAAAWGNPEDMRRTMEKASGAVAALMAPVAVGGFVFAPELLMFLFGSAYLPATGTVRLLMAAVFLAGFGITFGHPLLLWRHQRAVLVPLAAAVVVNAALNLWLIPRHGIEGAAAATLATEILTVIWFAVLQLRLGGALAAGSIVLHLAAAGAAAAFAKYIAGTILDITPTGASLPALLGGPLLFMIVYGALIVLPWWRTLTGACDSRRGG